MEIYCSQLGMVIEMGYCFSANSGLPCRMVIGCWGERIDIETVLKEKFTEEELKKAFGGIRKTKLQHMTDSIKTAKSTGKKE